MRSLLYVGLLAVVACYRLFFDLGRGPVWSDERIYVSVVDRMLETGDWIHLERLRDGVLEPYLNKPPLYFWLTAITRPMLGSGMAGYRFWSALFGLACVLATFQLGRRMHGPEVGLLAGLALATNRAFLDHHGARVACMDSALVLCAVVVFRLAWEMRDRERRIGLWAVIGLVCGVASLFKTLAGVPLLLLIGAYGLLCERGVSRRARVLGPIVGLAACLLVFAPWAVAAWSQHGAAFPARIWHDYVERATIDSRPGKARGVGYYVWFTTRSSWPFLLFLPALAFAAVAGFLRGRDPRGRFLSFAVVAWMAAMSVARTRYAWYAYPVYPLIAVSIAWLLVAGVTRAATPLSPSAP